MSHPLDRPLCCARIAAIVTLAAAGFAHSAFAQDAPAPNGALLDIFIAEDGAFLEEVENERRLMAEILQSTITQQIAAARDTCGNDPDAAIATLKAALHTVESTPDAPADVRAQLRDGLITAIKDCQRRRFEKVQRDQSLAEREAAGRQRRRAINETARREEKLEQIIARYNALLDEGRYREAEDAAYQARDLSPDAITNAAILAARTKGYTREMMAVREARHRAIVDALFRVEQAHVPFADEPPITYPHPQVWEELTLRRAKYAAMSLDKQGSAEERIFDALQDATTLEFIEMPLRDVMEFVEDLHGIEVEINYRALEDVGIGADTPITRNLKGISLRSALRLILRELDLTYAVRDEVLLITTPEEVAEDLTTKVYPVPDLVLPITTGGGANPFQMGAGLGNQGAFGGGLGHQGGAGNQMGGGNFGNLFGGGANRDPLGPLF